MSALDARIRLLAREEAVALAGANLAAEVSVGGDAQELAELRSMVEQLTARVEELEKSTSRRSTRSKTTTTEPSA